jgi:hypothetical protein
MPDGKIIDVGEPTRPTRLNSLGQLERLQVRNLIFFYLSTKFCNKFFHSFNQQSVLFWEFIEERILSEDMFASDSDSDSSDFLGFY